MAEQTAKDFGVYVVGRFVAADNVRYGANNPNEHLRGTAVPGMFELTIDMSREYDEDPRVVRATFFDTQDHQETRIAGDLKALACERGDLIRVRMGVTAKPGRANPAGGFYPPQIQFQAQRLEKLAHVGASPMIGSEGESSLHAVG